MPINVACPGCHASFQLENQLAGRQVHCQNCQTIFVASVPRPSANQNTLNSQNLPNPGYGASRHYPRRTQKQKPDYLLPLTIVTVIKVEISNLSHDSGLNDYYANQLSGEYPKLVIYSHMVGPERCDCYLMPVSRMDDVINASRYGAITGTNQREYTFQVKAKDGYKFE